MSTSKFILPGPDTVTLAQQTVDKLLRAGDGDAALLYLYIIKTNGQSSPEDAAAALNKGPGAIASAMAVLSRLGLIKCGENDEEPQTPPALRQESPREYSPAEIERELEHGADFKAVLEETQRSLGKILSPDELQRLFGIYDGLRLPPEVIMLLVTHCITESRKRGTGRAPSMRYIEKAAYTWEREGVFSLDRAEEYLKALDVRRGARGTIKSALQIHDRELSASEKRYVDEWIEMGFRADTIEIAYDRTVLKTGKLSWGYMDSIIKSWHEKGLKTPEDVMQKDGRAKKPAPKPDQKFGAPTTQELEEMKQFLKKLKEE